MAHDESKRLRRGEGPEVEDLHRTLLREAPEPVEGREPAPQWLWALVGALLFFGGWYLGRFSGPDVLAVHTAPVLEAVADETQVQQVSGESVYLTRCASCHQPTGLGVPGAFPPIVGSEWLAGDVPIRIVLRGLQGPIEVAGAAYTGVMPAWADQLSDDEIAAVVNHERQMAGVNEPPVDAAAVAALRTQTEGRASYTASELMAEGTP